MFENNTIQAFEPVSLFCIFQVFYSDTFRGRFGIVHKCLHKQNRLEYAAKYVRLRSKFQDVIENRQQQLHQSSA